MHFSDPSSARTSPLQASAATLVGGAGEYGSIFSQRGLSYDRAMRHQPGVRRLEFLQLFRNAPPQPREVVLDIPSLGHYLGWYEPRFETVIPLDFAPSFRPEVRTVSPDGDWDLPTPVTRVVCLAALHHLEDLDGFLANLIRQTGPGVKVHLADVGKGSRISRFLDDFVGRHTSTGHCGHYRDWERYTPPAGLIRREVCTLPCPWPFADRAAAAGFTRLLFGLERGSDAALLRALETMVGLHQTPTGGLTLDWELTYVDLERQ
ncbi:MAG: hypothetical protein ACKOXO_12370 [Cyanobium sp.]